ncbi:hypothetical protein HYH03_005827 [Edaphochlamys debaryana]|uniref:Uncharacterized protein n=1 Tax=Edaphochlamys debaryana TaxID=47281 RepID=A0A835Y6V2_9CHLO|nr:hypothetical protein HYH03_005827 [Edaphochlamys debaryana]|eukprot:KAG2496229.1 hypothetical protein HYH03_005827 [Edaphochlamys debaryana]
MPVSMLLCRALRGVGTSALGGARVTRALAASTAAGFRSSAGSQEQQQQPGAPQPPGADAGLGGASFAAPPPLDEPVASEALLLQALRAKEAEVAELRRMLAERSALEAKASLRALYRSASAWAGGFCHPQLSSPGSDDGTIGKRPDPSVAHPASPSAFAASPPASTASPASPVPGAPSAPAASASPPPLQRALEEDDALLAQQQRLRTGAATDWAMPPLPASGAPSPVNPVDPAAYADVAADVAAARVESSSLAPLMLEFALRATAMALREAERAGEGAAGKAGDGGGVAEPSDEELRNQVHRRLSAEYDKPWHEWVVAVACGPDCGVPPSAHPAMAAAFELRGRRLAVYTLPSRKL